MSPSVHISLKVRDLDRSVDFYRRLFGEPAKLKHDYAKFVGREPEIHLALGPGRETDASGPLSHLGIRVASTEEVRRIEGELRDRGLRPENEERGACCYAVQDKFWLSDPDGNRWEVYTVLEDVEAKSACNDTACCAV